MIYLIILAILSAYREVKVLIDRGSWSKSDYRNIFWDIDWKSKFKDFDSHHFSFGLFVLVLMEWVVRYLPTYIPFENFWLKEIVYQIYVIIYWLGFFYVRNIGMHIIFKKKPIYSYLWKFWS